MSTSDELRGRLRQEAWSRGLMVRSLLSLFASLERGRFPTWTSKERPLCGGGNSKAAWPTSGSLRRSGRRRKREMAFIFLPYFQHTSIFQNTNVLPQNTAELQHPARCIINDQERESLGSSLSFTHSPWLPYFP